MENYTLKVPVNFRRNFPRPVREKDVSRLK
jgi:hypothetical protein